MKPILDWSAYRDAGLGDAYADIPSVGGDFARAVAVCINSRRCETSGKGVMCPSYRVTQDPNLSPGGRVRLLKAALNQGSGAASFTDAPLAHSMALCVGCKGCRRECESAVDMAMLKVEYLAACHRRTGIPLRTRLLANLPRGLYAWPAMRRLVRWRNRSPWLARIGERFLGLSAARRLPEPATRPFDRTRIAPAGGSVADDGDQRSSVVLLVDTFTRHYAPENAEAAIRVLEAAGYEVITDLVTEGRPLCCGRTYIANGLVSRARTEARRVLSALRTHVDAGRSVVGLEPACLLALRDDYRFLGLGEDAERLSRSAVLFEEFIARERAAGRFDPPMRPVDTGGEPLLVHGHCHQKAVGAMKSMRKVLKTVPGLDFQMIESSCCGMAGSFGLEQEHAATAMAMAEQSLLPTLRAHPRSRILSNGFSCTHQIREGSGRGATHLARLLEEALAP